eukprot:TRINITY_DN932_c0_g1_i2.p1 TRINITY_DN932_c0_g1~~TRINITY_DN932_c0_g1_i2.p1  ORF type:complete len:221 (-),score=26.45 TRINITY_DN932_c0_g1_i2:316-978(-)
MSKRKADSELASQSKKKFVLSKEEKSKRRKQKQNSNKAVKNSLSKEEYLTSELRLKRNLKQHNKKKWKNVEKESINWFTPHIAVDLSYTKHLTDKENKSLGLQLEQMYSSLRSSSRPLKLHFTCANQIKLHMSSGVELDKWKVFNSDKNVSMEFDKTNLVYLSPDSPNLLDKIDHSKVYVIGGIVDHNRLKVHSYITPLFNVTSGCISTRCFSRQLVNRM